MIKTKPHAPTTGNEALPEGIRSQPHNLDVEQALLGAILLDNEAYHKVSKYLRPEHFYEPVHRRIFDSITQLIEGGRIADHLTLKIAFEVGETLRGIDGTLYLDGLERAAVTVALAENCGGYIHDWALKRGLIHVGQEMVDRAFDPTDSETGRDQIAKAEQHLRLLKQEVR